MRVSSWWRETGRLYVRYMTALGFSFPPAVAYAYLAANKMDTWWSTVALLVAGLATATLGWHFSARFFPAVPTVGSAEAYPDMAYEYAFRVTDAALEASYFALYNERAPQTSAIQQDLEPETEQARSSSSALAATAP